VLTRLAAIVTLLVTTAAARADRVVALAPLATLGAEDTSPATRKLTGELEAAIASLPATQVVRASQVADAIKRAGKPQLRACEADASCLTELAGVVGAQVVVSGEVGGLGESRVVYLAASERGAPPRSTTLAIGRSSGGDTPAAAVVRLLDPDRYRGTLRFAIDAPGATVYINGSVAAPSTTGELVLPVGAQAVRVTHPEYHDFVRFIDVEFGKTTDVTVDLQHYPIARHDVAGQPLQRDRIEYLDPPLWRRWYIVGPAAVGLAVVTTILAAYVSHNFPDDARCHKLGGGDC
jgi:hypothetical protein